VVDRDPEAGLPAAERVVIHLERVQLPAGLRALAYRDQSGNLVIFVSDELDAKAQRAAILEAIRASRRAGWRKTGLLPAGIGLALAVRALLGQVRHAISAQPVAWAAAATATVVGAAAAGVFIASSPHPRAPSAAGQPGTPSVTQPTGQQPREHGSHRRTGPPVAVAHVSPAPGQPATSGQPTPAPAGPSPTTQPGPRPSPSTTTTQPGPSPAPTPAPTPAPKPSPSSPPAPSPSPSPTGSPGTCIVLLGITVCLPPLLISLRV
jgi:hypothetical protein